MFPRAGITLALLWAGACPGSAAPGETRPVRRYTNEDLDRLRPLRAEVEPAEPAPAATSVPDPPPARARGEAYWREQAERLQDRLAPLAERAERLRTSLAERRRRAGLRASLDPRIEASQAELERLQARMRALEERLHERARREGALPGWLR